MSRKLGLVLAIVVSPLVGPREASSQESARWVDPPAENEEKVTYPDPPPPEPAETNSIVAEEAAQPSPAVPLPPPRVAADDVKSDRGSTEAAAVRPEVRPGARRAASTGDRRKVPRTAKPKQEVQRAARSRTSAPEARRRAAESPRLAPSQLDGPVPRTIDEALAAGLPVTTVRTYVLPDGRRVEVITEIAPTGPPPRSRTY